MKLIKLKMSAFGPYGAVETINFQKFYKSNLFLITGDTGSGKTTIFDAICFALYGTACGQTKESKTLRSSFANLHQVCFVEFEFEIRGKRYLIKRLPEQEIAKTKGKGLKQIKHSAQLFLPNGEVIVNLKEINKIIVKNLIGFDRINFNKIVMLPQGQFQKLLTEKGEQQLKTFRKIFETEIYDSVTTELFNFKQKILKKFENLEQNTLKTFELIKCDDFEFFKLKHNVFTNVEKIVLFLKNKNLFDKTNLINLEIISAKIDRSLQKLEAQIQICELISLKKDSIMLINKNLEKLKNKQPKLEKFENSKIIMQQIENLKFFKQTFDDLNLEFERKKLILNNNEKKLKETTENLNKCSKNEEIVQNLNMKLNIKQNKLFKLKNIQQSINLVNEFDIELNNLKLNFQKIEFKLKQLQFQKNYFNLKNEINLQEKIVHSLNELVKIQLNRKNLKSEIANLNSIYIKMCDDFLKQQALLLSTKLKIGTPCPVCGETVKKIKKINVVKNVLTQNEISQVQNKILTMQNNLNELVNKINLNRINLEVNFSVKIDDGNNNLKEEILNRFENLKLLKINLKNMSNKFLNKNKLLNMENNFDEKIENLTIEKEKILAQIFTLKSKKNKILKEIPKNLHEKNEILKLTKLVECEIRTINQEKENLIKNKIETEKNYASLKSQCLEMSGQLNELLNKKNFAKMNFKNKLKKCNLSLNKFNFYLKNLEKIKNFILNSQNIFNEISKLELEKKALQTELNKTQNLNIVKLKQLKLKKTKRKKLVKLLENSLTQQLAINENCFKILNESKMEIANLNEQFGAAKILADVAKGSKKRIGFERYVLINFINEILSVASIYFKKTTNGRFIFEKIVFENIDSLNLNVFDIYSGKVRNVSTLSGGETFMAALALSLSLRNVVSSKTSTAELNTMLIDEGFGTLDSNCLNTVVSCLQNLSHNNNLVGIISHVKSLKEQISNQIQVNACLNGAGSELKTILN